MAEDEMRRDDFFDAEVRLTAAFLLVKHLDDCRHHADEIIFCQRVRSQLRKALSGRKKKGTIEQAVRDLVDDAVESEGVVDIFTAAGLPHADISVLDEQFLQTFKDKPQQNLRLMLLQQLLADEIRRRQPRNVAQAKSFRELLEKTLQRYHNRLIDAATVVAEMLRMKQEMDASDARARQLGLAEEEVAFYDAVAENAEGVYDEPFLRDTINVPYWREKMTAFPSVKLRMDFRDPNIVGTFPYHCHLLEHQDGGMMGIIRVEPPLATAKPKRPATRKIASLKSAEPRSN
jgi:type I restriction enzyme R subunit